MRVGVPKGVCSTHRCCRHKVNFTPNLECTSMTTTELSLRPMVMKSTVCDRIIRERVRVHCTKYTRPRGLFDCCTTHNQRKKKKNIPSVGTTVCAVKPISSMKPSKPNSWRAVGVTRGVSGMHIKWILFSVPSNTKGVRCVRNMELT